jgi:E2/UBC family protein E
MVATQLADIQARHPEARLETPADGQQVLVVPEVTLPEGWTVLSVTLRVLVPAGYPHVNPDCFYTDETLRLASGVEPANSSIQPIFGGQYRWFSWHLSSWDPGSDGLEQYVRFCERRLRECR